MTTQHVCQSCGMPVAEEKMMGTEKDGSPSKGYCTYCYQDGRFVQEVSLEEMIEVCVPHMLNSGMPEDDARNLLKTTLPNLSRWK